MTVKTIFKVLVGTIVIMVFSTLLLELSNAAMYSSYINMYIKTSMRKGCEYITSETYRSGRALVEDLGAIKMRGGADTSLSSLNGKIYGNKTGEDAIFSDLYKNVNHFKNFTSHLHRPSATVGTGMSIDAWWGINDNMYYLTHESSQIGSMYREMYMTPANLGIPFVGEPGAVTSTDNVGKALVKIDKWILAKLLSGGNEENIYTSNGRVVVNYHGYEIDIDSFQITDKDYVIYKLDDPTDAKAFNDVTNMNASTLVSDASAFDVHNNAGKYAVTVALSYSVKVNYKGITPFRRVFSWIMMGMPDATTADTNGEYHNPNTDEGLGYGNFLGDGTSGNRATASDLTFNTEATLTGGGYDRRKAGVTQQASSNMIVYYIIH